MQGRGAQDRSPRAEELHCPEHHQEVSQNGHGGELKINVCVNKNRFCCIFFFLEFFFFAFFFFVACVCEPVRKFLLNLPSVAVKNTSYPESEAPFIVLVHICLFFPSSHSLLFFFPVNIPHKPTADDPILETLWETRTRKPEEGRKETIGRASVAGRAKRGQATAEETQLSHHSDRAVCALHAEEIGGWALPQRKDSSLLLIHIILWKSILCFPFFIYFPFYCYIFF